jgi:GH43 family beta-xylosidase
MMREDGAQLAINSKDRKSSVQRKAKGYVDSILNEVAAFPDDRTGIMMSEHVLNKANEDMSYILSALPPREAQELREAIYMEVSKAVSPKDSRRDRALKLLGKLSPELHTEKGRNKLMKAAATSESYKNTALGQGLLEFIEQSETTKQINGSNE